MRDDVPKVIFLITDGAQKPTEDKDGNPYDPVAASQPLIDRGIQIFSIGVGNRSDNIDYDQLVKISRSEKQVKIADTAADLASEQFVKDLATITCKVVRKEILRSY